MTVYPDTSHLVALRFLVDIHHTSATEYSAARTDETFLWSPWHRVEVSNDDQVRLAQAAGMDALRPS
jgi:hypothetical protein